MTLLQGSLGKKLNRSTNKEDIIYNFEEASEGLDGKKTYEASVTSAEFQNGISYSGTGDSEKAAKEDAAKAAVESEFPEAFEKNKNSIENKSKSTGKNPPQKKKKATQPTAKKGIPGNLPQKGDQKGRVCDDSKSLLCNVMALVLGRPAKKTDLVWDVTNNGKSHDPDFSISVTLQVPDLTTDSFSGTGGTKKEAEYMAAQQAYEAIKPLVLGLPEGKEKGNKRKQQEAHRAQHEKLAKFDDALKIFITPIAKEVTDAAIKTFSAKVGAVTSAERLSTSKNAIVVYKTSELAEKAIKTLNGTSLAGSKVNVTNWVSKKKA